MESDRPNRLATLRPGGRLAGALQTRRPTALRPRPVIEVIAGGRWAQIPDGVIAVTGGRVASTADWRAVRVARGSIFAVGTIAPGLRTYIAVRGGINVPSVLGSRSFCQLGAVGGGLAG